jgi:membrane associated rhomboid family serine protease
MPRFLTHLRNRLGLYAEYLCFAPAARWLTIACLAIFLVQRLSSGVEASYGISFGSMFQLLFGLCPPLLAKGFWWQLLTYIFLHGNLLHLLLNMLTLLLIGTALEMEIGPSRFLRVFTVGGVLGGLAWALFVLAAGWLAEHSGAGLSWLHAAAVRLASQRGVNVEGVTLCVGASGAIFGLIGAYAALYPRRRLVLLLGWPVVVRARTAALLLGTGTIAFAAFGLGNVAYLTHMAGGLAGYAYGRRLAADGWGDDTDDHDEAS